MDSVQVSLETDVTVTSYGSSKFVFSLLLDTVYAPHRTDAPEFMPASVAYAESHQSCEWLSIGNKSDDDDVPMFSVAEKLFETPVIKKIVEVPEAKQPQSTGLSAEKQEDVFTQGDWVALCGLRQHDLNDSLGSLISLDVPSHRWGGVRLQHGRLVKIKPCNLICLSSSRKSNFRPPFVLLFVGWSGKAETTALVSK